METRCETHLAQSAKYSYGSTTCRSQRNYNIYKTRAIQGVSQIFVAHKPDGRVRLGIDLRDVNSKIIVEHYPMPNIHEMLFALSSVESISRILEQKVFFRFTRVPFGLASVSSVFQRMRHKMFKDVKGVLYFQEDILIHTKDQEEHDKLLYTVLTGLKKNGLTSSGTSANFIRPQ